MILNTLDLRQDPGRRPTIHCNAAGCVRATRDGKPYCSKHVAHNTYVAQLLKDIRRRRHNER